jgi:hypothetical protein
MPPLTAEQAELLLQISLFERHHKPNETNRIERKTDDTMIRSEREQLSICENDMLEVVDNAFAVQEVIRDGKEVPVQSFAPWILLALKKLARFWCCVPE